MSPTTHFPVAIMALMCAQCRFSPPAAAVFPPGTFKLRCTACEKKLQAAKQALKRYSKLSPEKRNTPENCAKLQALKQEWGTPMRKAFANLHKRDDELAPSPPSSTAAPSSTALVTPPPAPQQSGVYGNLTQTVITLLTDTGFMGANELSSIFCLSNAFRRETCVTLVPHLTALIRKQQNDTAQRRLDKFHIVDIIYKPIYLPAEGRGRGKAVYLVRFQGQSWDEASKDATLYSKQELAECDWWEPAAKRIKK